MALSAQAFVGLIPALLVVVAVTPDTARDTSATALVDGLDLSGIAAAEVSTLVHRPPGVETVTVVGAVLLVSSVLGFTRTLQRTYIAAWGLPPPGVRGLVHGVLAAVVVVVELVALALCGPFLAVVVPAPLGVLVHAAVAVLLWWPIQRILLDGRVGWRDLLPGALLTGVGQAVVLSASGSSLPLVISHQAGRYGLIGIAFALLTWLLVLGLLLVLSAVVGAELPRERRDDLDVGLPV